MAMSRHLGDAAHDEDARRDLFLALSRSGDSTTARRFGQPVVSQLPILRLMAVACGPDLTAG